MIQYLFYLLKVKKIIKREFFFAITLQVNIVPTGLKTFTFSYLHELSEISSSLKKKCFEIRRCNEENDFYYVETLTSHS